MAQQTKFVRLSEDLEGAAKARAQKLGYRDLASYIRGLIRYDCFVGGGEHAITEPISRRSLDEQDRIDREIRQLVEQGKDGGRGVLLDHLIERALNRGVAGEEDLKRQLPEEI